MHRDIKDNIKTYTTVCCTQMEPTSSTSNVLDCHDCRDWMNTGQICSFITGSFAVLPHGHTHKNNALILTHKQLAVFSSPDLHVFELGEHPERANWTFGTRYEALKTLNADLSFSLSLCYIPHFFFVLHIYTIWFCMFLFPAFFFSFYSFPLPLYFLHPLPHLVQ